MADLRGSGIPTSPFSLTYVAVETYNALAEDRDRLREALEAVCLQLEHDPPLIPQARAIGRGALNA